MFRATLYDAGGNKVEQRVFDTAQQAAGWAELYLVTMAEDGLASSVRVDPIKE